MPDRSIRALRARLATEIPIESEPAPEPRPSRGLLVFAVCFAVGVWIAVFALVIAPEKTKQLFQMGSAAASQPVAVAVPGLRYAQVKAEPQAPPRNCSGDQQGYGPGSDPGGNSCEPRLRH